jgi:hypothetical protein
MTAAEHDLVVAANPRHVLDELDEATGRERSLKTKVRQTLRPAPEKAVVTVETMHVGRLTGWGVKCSEHGTLGPSVDEPLVIPKRKAARAVGLDHAQREHPEGARLVVKRAE